MLMVAQTTTSAGWQQARHRSFLCAGILSLMLASHQAIAEATSPPGPRPQQTLPARVTPATAGIANKADKAANATRIGYLELKLPQPPLLSNLTPEPEDSGLQGARLGLAENNTAGRFRGLSYNLVEAVDTDFQKLLTQAEDWYRNGLKALVVNLPAAELKQLSDRFSDRELVIFNSGSADDSLRYNTCLANVVHTLPSRAMLTDALAQWLRAKRLSRWLLIVGTRENDRAYADALRRSAKRFGGRIVAEKTWTFNSDLRRSAQAEVPLFTQAGDYDVVVVADELGDFGEYILYNTWLPRPVVGTQGLTPTAWHRVVEQWGAAQLQHRFMTQAGRGMNAHDYAAWIAVRSVDRALTLKAAPENNTLQKRLYDPQFNLAGFKGRKLSYRAWNGQLRQPIPLVHPRALVSQSPQEGFLHPTSDLDTLGYDAPESQCQLGRPR